MNRRSPPSPQHERTPGWCPSLPHLKAILALFASLLPMAASAQLDAYRSSPPPVSLISDSALLRTSTAVALQAQPEQRGVDANTAGEELLRSIPGIGPAMAQRIIQTRERKAFRDLRDFAERVPGIGPKRLQQFSEAGLMVKRQAPVTKPPDSLRPAPTSRAAPETRVTPPGQSSAAPPGAMPGITPQASEAATQDVQVIEGGVREAPYRDQAQRARR